MEGKDRETEKKIVILATGGTIAGTGSKGTSVGYDSGILSIEELLDSIPRINNHVGIETVQICNANSDDIGSRIWISLAKEIERQSARPDVAGIVITHGTDTLEETAYFLDLVIKTEKPVILTGSMRPATAVSADGPMNLLEAISAAAHPDSSGRGVLIQFAGKLYCARNVSKVDSTSICAMSGGIAGECGIVRDGQINYLWKSDKPHTNATEFSIDTEEELPAVSVIYFNADADPKLIKAAANISKGLVIAGAGAGEFSLEFAEVINELEIPVVVSSRVEKARVEQESLICQNAIASRDLSPQKAAILLRLAISKGYNKMEINRLFETY